MRGVIQKLVRVPIDFVRGLDKYITIMVVPHRATKKALSIQVKERTVFFSFLGVGLVVFVVAFAFVYSSSNSKRLVFFRSMIDQAEKQEGRLLLISERTDELNRLVRELDQREGQIRKMLGLPVKSLYPKELMNGTTGKQPNSNMETVEGQIESVRSKLETSRSSLDSLRAFVMKARSRFDATPTEWPLHGRIVSRYGWRTSPWRGMHTGIDVKAPYGARVYSTADGRVKYSGWRQGYGRTVIIDHGNGIETLYGHNAKLLVDTGERVKKGQVVSTVGLTGYTTGTHCHYEVRVYGKPVNPSAFLDLNVRQAAAVLNKYRVHL